MAETVATLIGAAQVLNPHFFWFPATATTNTVVSISFEGIEMILDDDGIVMMLDSGA